MVRRLKPHFTNVSQDAADISQFKKKYLGWFPNLAILTLPTILKELKNNRRIMLNKFNVNRECHSPFIVRGSTLGTTNSLKFYIMGDPNSKEPFDSLEELLNFVMSKMPILKQRRVPRVPATTMDM